MKDNEDLPYRPKPKDRTEKRLRNLLRTNGQFDLKLLSDALDGDLDDEAVYRGNL